MLYTSPALTNTQAHAMHSKRGASQGRPVLKSRHHGKAPAQPFPSYPAYGPPSQLVGEGTRQFMAMLSHFWIHEMTLLQTEAFVTLAATQPITLNDGSTKIVTAYQWYVWWNSVNYFNSFGPTYPIDPITYPPLQDAPGSWDPPATPTGPFNFQDFGPLYKGFSITSTPTYTFGYAYMLIPYWRAHPGQRDTEPTVRVNCLINSSSGGTGEVDLNALFGGIVPSMDHVSGRSVIFRISSTWPNLIPSAALRFTWP